MEGMNTTLIIGIVAVIVVLAIVALVLGLNRKKSKTVSFAPKEEAPKELTQEEKSGNYQAQGGFSFAPAKAEAEPVAEQVPVVPVVEEAAPQAAPVEEKLNEHPEVEPLTDADVPPEAEATEEFVAEAEADKIEAEEPEGFEELDEFEEAQEPKEPEEAEEAEEPEEAVAEEAAEAAAAAATVAEAAAEAKEETPVPAEEPEAEAEPQQQLDQIDPATGRIGRLRGRLARSQSVFGKSVLGMISAGDLDDDAWEEVEDELVQADLGAGTTAEVVDELRERIASRGVSSEEEARAMLREVLIKAGQPDMDRSIKAMPYEGKPAVILVVGVNGTGKTTTTGKLARVLVSMGHSVVLGAADTFRAAAADQLETWGRRVGAVTVRGKEGADPASVAFDAVSEGVNRGADVVLIDTAGRLHNSANLMDQLGKVKRVVEKKAVVDEVLLVLDATTGQNGMIQAQEFSKVVQITGVALTKLDGTAKGGIVFRVQNELGVPVKLVGLGEGADDLAPFEVEGFVDALLGGH